MNDQMKLALPPGIETVPFLQRPELLRVTRSEADMRISRIDRKDFSTHCQ